MSTYTVETLPLAPVPTGNIQVTINYKLAGTIPWTTAATNVVVEPNGTLPVSIPITGLTIGATYLLQAVGECGSPPSTFQTSIIAQ